MTEATATRSVIVERLMPHAPEKVWRADAVAFAR